MKAKKQRDKRISVSGMNLLRLAAERSFDHVFAYMLVWNLILLLCCMLGGMTITMFLTLLLLVNSGIFAFAIRSSFRAKCGWHNVRAMRALLKNKAMTENIHKITFSHQNNAWEYADADWFIRVNGHSACILFAPALDFSIPIKHTKQVIYNDFARKRMYAETKEYHRYTFQTKEKVTVSVKLDCTGMFLKWIQQHGGQTVRME